MTLGRRLGLLAKAGVALIAPMALGPMSGGLALDAEETVAKLPDPPADGIVGLVVTRFAPTIVQDKDACPNGPSPKMRDAYLERLPEAERARLSLKENEPELTRLWKAESFGPDGANICTNPEMFDRPLQRTVLDLDGDGGKGGKNPGGCAQQNFVSPLGEAGIDNQEYRAMGCQLEYRGVDGIGGDMIRGSTQFHTSGEWTQVLLLRGVDSLVNDPSVEVIYANTPDRPVQDLNGKVLSGGSFTVATDSARRRNVLRGKIEGGVLTTEAKDIELAQTWGQGGARDIRGNRTTYSFRRGQLRLRFQPDGSVIGLLGGYRPIFDVISAQGLGGAGSALVAGMDCASQLATLRKMADGYRDPKTGQCTAVSSAINLIAVPAFVNDLQPSHRTAVR
jgi:hypothetical protein